MHGQTRQKIIEELRDLNLASIHNNHLYSDSEFVRLYRATALLDELIEEVTVTSIRDLPDALVAKAGVSQMLGRNLEAYELLLEAVALENLNYAAYQALVRLFRDMGATDCADFWMHKYMFMMASSHGHLA